MATPAYVGYKRPMVAKDGPSGDEALRFVVGVGASAGGTKALQDFFGTDPPSTDIAFLVVIHTSPGAQTLLPEILAHHTTLPIVQVDAPLTVKPGKIYLPPSGFTLEVERDTVCAKALAPLERKPIDDLF